jgi:hypothetical protein
MAVSRPGVQTWSPVQIDDPHWELRIVLAALAVVLIVVGLAVRLDGGSLVQRRGITATPTPRTTIRRRAHV